MKLDNDINTYFSNENLRKNAILPSQNYVVSCQGFHKLTSVLNKLARRYKSVSNELILQINRITNCKTTSLSQFYKSICVMPSNNSLLQYLIDIFRDSIIINYQQQNLNTLWLTKTTNISPKNDNLGHVNITHNCNDHLLESDNISARIRSGINFNDFNFNGSDISNLDNTKSFDTNTNNSCTYKRNLYKSPIGVLKKQCIEANCIERNCDILANGHYNSLTNHATVNNHNVNDILLHSLKNPLSVFKSILLKEIFNGINVSTLNSIIANSQIFIPEVIIYLSNQLWVKCLLLKDETILSKYGINDLITSINKSSDFVNHILNGIKHNNLKSIYFQICGKALSKDTILSLNNKSNNGVKGKQLNWSNIYIPRSRIMYRSSFNNFSLPSCSLLKFRKFPTRLQCRMLLNNILFNNDLMDDKNDAEIVKKIQESIDAIVEEDNFRYNKKTLIGNMEDHFYQLIIKLHNFSFKEYLDKHCPRKIIHLNSLVELNQIPSLDYSINVDNVVSFVQDIINNLITDDLLGNNHNKLIFLKTCRTLVRLNRNETINIDRLIRNIKAKNCKWIQIEANNSYNRTLVIRNYLSKLIYILHKHLTCPLLWSCFYITESGNSINKLYYFRKSDWYKLERIADSHLSNSNYEISDKSIEYNKIRWVPKSKGMRPIWNLSNLPASSEFIESIDNQQCMCNNSSNSGHKCFKCYITSGIKKTNKKSRTPAVSRNTFLYLPRVILSYLCRHKSKLMGSSVMGYTQVYKRLNNWWNRFCSIYKRNCIDYKLYIVVADLSMCYESILHENLIKVINNLPIPRHFLFTRGYCRAFTRLSLKTKSLGCLGTRIDIIDTRNVERCDNWLKKFRRQSILKCLVGGGVCIVSRLDQCQISVTRNDLNEIIKTLLKTLTITLKPNGIGKVIMRQTCGIPQGCCISSFLCSLYMASKDKLISKLFNSKVVTRKNKITMVPNLLLRWIDDFIFISANKDDAMQMSKILLDAEVFDARVNLDKLNANFEPYNKSQLEWLGMKFSFDIANEKVNIEMEPWRNLSNVIRDSFSFRISGNDFMQTILIDRLYGYLSNRLCHGLFSCSKINSNEYIIQNAYVIMRICMLKLVCGIDAIIFEFGGFINYNFIVDTIFNLIDHAMTLISRRCKLYGYYKYILKAHLLSAATVTVNSVIDQLSNANISDSGKCGKKDFKFMLKRLLKVYRKGIKQISLPKVLKRTVLYQDNNKIYNIARNISEIESKFDGKWPNVT